MTPYAVLEKLAQSASVPVFVMHDTLLGSGAVGGHVQSGQKVGWAIADLLMGAQPKDFSKGFFSHKLFDAKALQRWQIPPKIIPDNSTILYQEHSVWDEYKFEISMALLIALIETLILVFLFKALRGKRSALANLSKVNVLPPVLVLYQ